jgi:adenylate cyclase
MSKWDYAHYDSFGGKARVAFFLSSMVPILVIIYLFIQERINLTDTILLFAPLVLFSVLSGFSLLRRSTDELAALARETGRVSDGEITGSVKNSPDRELNDIALHFNTVLGKLKDADRSIREQSMQLLTYARDLSVSYKKSREEETLRSRLSRYVDANLVEKLMTSRGKELFENERKRVTILFADIRSFTSISERLPAEEVVSMLNQFFSAMTDIIFKHSGVLDKFVGDQIVAVFGLVSSGTMATVDAVQTALAMQEVTANIMRNRKIDGKMTFQIGIGINTGTAIVGNIGSENRMDYTVIGDCVNVAARLQQVAEGGQILVSEHTFAETKARFPYTGIGKLSLKNRVEPVSCYRICREEVKG